MTDSVLQPMNNSFDKVLEMLNSVKWEEHVEGLTMDEIEVLLGETVAMPDTVTYVPNYRSGALMYHRGFDTVLGYPADTEIDLPFILSLVHPDDLPIVQYLSQVALDFHLSKDLNKPFSTIFEVNCRIRKFNGDYVMMLRRGTGFLNRNEIPVASLSFLHDIDFIKGVKHVSSRIIGPAAVSTEFQRRLDELSYGQTQVGPFTARESQVLQLLAQGLRSAEIAEKLSISVHTVNNHRKNMIRKSGLQNTADLIRFGLENGLI